MRFLLRWLKERLTNQRYDRGGNARFLIEREHLEFPEISPDCPQKIVVEVLELVCECFDIPQCQIRQIRESDRIWMIYEEVRVSKFHDDMELERISMELEERVLDFKATAEFLQSATVGDLIKLIAEQDAAPQIRPRWWVGGLTGGGDVVEVVEAR